MGFWATSSSFLVLSNYCIHQPTNQPINHLPDSLSNDLVLSPHYDYDTTLFCAQYQKLWLSEGGGAPKPGKQIHNSILPLNYPILSYTTAFFLA